jgi:hypothetical protein
MGTVAMRVNRPERFPRPHGNAGCGAHGPNRQAGFLGGLGHVDVNGLRPAELAL